MFVRKPLICLSLMAIFGSPPLLSYSQKKDKPNILLIVADDLGFSDLGCYGGEIDTRNIDDLASNGIRMTRFYSTGRCCPSRASILTGLYPHRAGLGHMVKDLGMPGYRGRLSEDAITIAQALKPSGYRSFVSGKWHLGTPDPTQHGFEQFYGTLVSAQTFWDPDHYLRKPEGAEVRTYANGEFYGTNAITDYAMDFLNIARNTPEHPWFLYLAYNAPHFPLQAPKKIIEKYIQTYEVGWDSIRLNRYLKQKQLGIIDNNTSLSPPSKYWDWGEQEAGTNPLWDQVDLERKADLIRRMAIYAAMVETMDSNIGRILDNLKKFNEIDNTIIIFISDNGACAEWNPLGFDGESGPNNKLHREQELEAMGGPKTYHSVGSAWANASNTPWRLYKHFNHEGGISSPFIVHWPIGLKRHGIIEKRPGHLIDLMPTLLGAANAEYPIQIHGLRSAPISGINLLPLLQGEEISERYLYFEHEGNKAIIGNPWKLTLLRGANWELYNIITDRAEQINLASVFPDVVKRLEVDWNKWAEENYVTPLPKNYEVPYLGNLENLKDE